MKTLAIATGAFLLVSAAFALDIQVSTEADPLLMQPATIQLMD